MLTINAQSEEQRYGGLSYTDIRRTLKYFVADDMGERVFEVDAGSFKLEAMAASGSMLVESECSRIALQKCIEFCGGKRFTVERANIAEQERLQASYETWLMCERN